MFQILIWHKEISFICYAYVFLGMSSLKQPLKIMRHNGIPIILHNKIQKKELKETATKDDKPKKPIVANPAQIKVNIYKGFWVHFKSDNLGFCL